MVVDRVYGVLRQMLISGQFEPGCRINLNELTRLLHVSNTPVRQALNRLEAEGLVTREVNRGYVASVLLDSRTIAELYDYRLLVEPAATARAATRPLSLLGRLERLSEPDVVATLIADPRQAASLRQRDLDFHSTIAESAGNRVLACHLGTVLRSMAPYALYHSTSEAATASWAEHRQIIEAIRSGDKEASAVQMREHLFNSHERLRTAIPRRAH